MARRHPVHVHDHIPRPVTSQPLQVGGHSATATHHPHTGWWHRRLAAVERDDLMTLMAGRFG